MAGILHANSIIADSTACSSSPPRPSMDLVTDTTNAASLTVEPRDNAKRVRKTYGRPKADVDRVDAAREDSGSRARILKTSPPDTDNQVIPESDDADERNTNFKNFDWRAKLKSIDEKFDVSEGGGSVEQTANASATQGHDASPACQNADGTLHPAPNSSLSSLSHLSPVDADERTIDGISSATTSLFDGSLNTLLSSARTAGSPHFSGKTARISNDEESVALSRRPRPHKRVESPEQFDSDNTSPRHPYPINSPKQQSSPTPPTSPLAGEFNIQEASESGDDSPTSAKPGKKTMETKKGKATDKGKGREKRTKAPTKKEVLEIQKESARLLADQHVSIRRTQAHSTHTIQSLFNKLKHTPVTTKQDSDPITSFSSPGRIFETSHDASDDDSARPVKSETHEQTGTSSKAKKPVGHAPRASAPKHRSSTQPGGDDDDDMPDPDVLLRGHDAKRVKQAERAVAEQKAKELEERKRKALEFSKLQSAARARSSTARLRPGEATDTDDDLEVVEDMVGVSDGVPSGKGKDMKSFIGRSAHRIYGGRSAEKTTSPGVTVVSQKSLELAARPAFMPKKGSKQTGKHDTSVSQRDLNALLLQRADKQGSAIDNRKKEQWIKAGGVLKDRRRADAEEKSVTDWLHKGSTREDAMEVDDEEDEEGNNSEYRSDGVNNSETGESDTETGEAEALDGPLDQRMDISDDDGDKENHRPPRRQSVRAVVDSDEEDEEEPTDRTPVILVPDTSFTADDEGSPGEDKENSRELAFDLGEDKENARVPRHVPLGRLSSSDLTSPSPIFQAGGGPKAGREPLSRLDDEEESAPLPPPLAQRGDSSQDRILQVLHEEDKDATLTPRTSMGQEGHRRSSWSPASDNENAVAPKLVSIGGFSQLFSQEQNEEVPGPRSALGESSFSQSFSPGKTLSDDFHGSPLNKKAEDISPRQHNRSGPAAEKNEFEFTQPSDLLPSVSISASQRREVDEMFGKDQEFKLNEARRTRESTLSDANNVSGFLNFGPFVSSQLTQLSPRSIRRPLETLSLDSGGADTPPNKSPALQLFRRGRLLRERPREPQAIHPNSSPSPPPKNAFDVLRDAAASKGKGRERPKKSKLEKSEYIEAEAQESDEEAMIGFGGAKGQDDDEGMDEDLDAIVPDLVDDTAIDEKAQAAELVLEKHMEHQAADDAALEKLHQDAVDGKLRGKRRDRGVGLEDSDSEEESRGPRKLLYKKRRVEGDTLDAYGQIPETRPFYDSYHTDLAVDDDPTLTYLQQEDPAVPTELEAGDDYEEDEPAEEISTAEIEQQVRNMGKQGELPVATEVDLQDISWLEQDDQDVESDMEIKEIESQSKKSVVTGPSALDHVGFRGSFKGKRTIPGEQVQLKTWASQEARTHYVASGRGGFSRKEDGTRVRKQGRATVSTRSTAPSGETRALTKNCSLLSHVAKSKGFDC